MLKGTLNSKPKHQLCTICIAWHSTVFVIQLDYKHLTNKQGSYNIYKREYQFILNTQLYFANERFD